MAFDYAKAYQQFIDEEFGAASATAWMIPEAGKVRFTGAGTLRSPPCPPRVSATMTRARPTALLILRAP